MKTTTSKHLLALAVLNGLGVALSLYSLHHHITLEHGLQTEPSFCNISATFNCDAVNSSEWSTILGLPVASYGIAFYALFCLFVLLAMKPARVPTSISASVATVASLGAVGFSIYLFGISTFAIGTVCLICVSLYVINLLLLGVSYSAGRPASLLTQIRSGTVAILQLPALALGLGRFRSNPHKNGACGWLAAAIALVVALLSQPQHIIRANLNLSSLAHNGEMTQAQEALEYWKNSTPVSISENTSGSRRDYFKGPSDAPITIVEFSDFQCPACRRFYTGLHELLSTYNGKIRVIHRNFPIDQTCNVNIPQPAHLNSCYAALFTRCAGEQGRFWEAADYIFTLPSIDAGAPPETIQADIDAGTQTLGLDSTAMTECLDAERQQRRIMDDIAEAMTLGLQMTPTVWINNRPLLRVTRENLVAVIEHILAEQGKSVP